MFPITFLSFGLGTSSHVSFFLIWFIIPPYNGPNAHLHWLVQNYPALFWITRKSLHDLVCLLISFSSEPLTLYFQIFDFIKDTSKHIWMEYLDVEIHSPSALGFSFNNTILLRAPSLSFTRWSELMWPILLCYNQISSNVLINHSSLTLSRIYTLLKVLATFSTTHLDLVFPFHIL